MDLSEASRERDETLQALRVERKDKQHPESITDLFFSLDREWRFVDINRNVARFVRARRNNREGIWEVYPNAVNSPLFLNFHKAVTRAYLYLRAYLTEVEGVWFEVHAHPFDELLSVYLATLLSVNTPT